jgi:hypothetical protein
MRKQTCNSPLEFEDHMMRLGAADTRTFLEFKKYSRLGDYGSFCVEQDSVQVTSNCILIMRFPKSHQLTGVLMDVPTAGLGCARDKEHCEKHTDLRVRWDH